MLASLPPLDRSEFEGILEKTPAEANAFLADPEKYLHCEIFALIFENFLLRFRILRLTDIHVSVC